MSAKAEEHEKFFTRGAPPTGTCVILVRHGEADVNVNGVIGGVVGCTGLTERGRAQSRELRDRLMRSHELDDVTALYTSVLPRAIETAEIIRPGLPSGLQFVQDCDLCEQHPGEADGLTWEELVSRFGWPNRGHEPSEPFAPGGESWIGFYDRCVRILAQIVQRHPGERVVLVVHGGLIEQAMKVLAGETPAGRLGLRTENCSMTEIEFAGVRRRLLRYNDLAPLAAE